MKFSNKTYDALNWVAMVLLPAIAVLYMGLAKVWPFPYVSEVVGTIAAIDTFLGAVLGLSTVKFNTGIADTKPIVRSTIIKTLSTSWIMSNQLYDLTKLFVQVILPAAATLYLALGNLWGWVLVEPVVATIMLVDTFLGMLLDFNKNQFNIETLSRMIDKLTEPVNSKAAAVPKTKS